MPYNDKYFFNFGNLKQTNQNVLHYKVVLSKLEAVSYTYDLIELQAANSPFVLTYRSPEDNAFSPIKTSSAEINILYPYDPAVGTPEPDDFIGFDRSYQWQVRFYEVTSSGTVETLKWQGYIIDNDIQYEWQDAYYYRMTATDNLAVIKDLKFNDADRLGAPDYNTFDGVTVSQFIQFILNTTGNELNCKFAGALFNNGNEYTLDQLWTSYYAGIDWKNRTPRGNYEILNDLLTALGCIVYLDNNDAKWTVLMINEISNRPNNEVPYVEYDPTFTYVTDGVLQLNSSINVGTTDLIWRDKNQIASYKKPYNYINFLHPYIPKNLSSNYSFQEDLIHTNWEDVGTFATDVKTITPLSKQYDRNYLDITTNENTIDPINVTDRIRQTYDFLDTNIYNAVDELFAIYVNFNTRLAYRGVGSGYNFQIQNQRVTPTSTIYFDASSPANIAQDGGVWVSATDGRLPVFANINGTPQNVTCFTKYIKTNYIVNLNFLSYRTANAVAGGYSLDEVIVNITPLGYKNLEQFGYIAGFFGTNFYFTAGKEFKTIFNGGAGNNYDWYIFEGAIGYKETSFNKFVCDRLWDRYQEQHNESTFGALTEITARSVLEFYGRTSRKIVGNVYGNEISYPKYFEVQSAVDRGYLTGIANTFEFRVNADAGFTETSLCGSNYLSEYAVKNADFLMVEATFDYSQATTNVNIHEDNSLNTGQNFEIYSGVGGYTYGNGIFPQQYGGTSNGTISAEE